jgi:lipopolysaccharide transport system permease protein
MSKREVNRRYKGSFLGVLWVLITPLAMMVIYTFVFSVVLKTRWGDTTNVSTIDYALNLFAGLIPFSIFAEVINQSPSLILINPNYVKKVVFPLEILPIVTLLGVLVNSCFSLAILLLGMAIFKYPFYWTIFLLPLIYVPLVLITLGFAWFLASIGVFVRDIDSGIRIITQLLLFVTPVFYPLERVPVEIQNLLKLNPLTFIVISYRRLLLWGQPLVWGEWLFWVAVGFIIALLGLLWFRKSRHAFADVI